MPHYSYRKTFTAGRDSNSQQELEMKCSAGILKDVTIHFPAGCQALVHIHIDDELHQIFPTNAEETYALDDYTLPIADTYELLPEKRKIYIKGWNEDDTYDHTIAVAFTVTPRELYNPVERVLIKILSILERIFGKSGIK